MKRCPQCGAEYDNHVEFCFVDGTELSQLDTTSVVSPRQPPALRPARSRVVPLVFVGVLFVVATPLVVIGVIYVMGLSSEPEPEAPLLAEPTPAIPNPVERLEPVEPEVISVRVESIPPGAEVWEGETRLCDRTPCSIDQPDHAPAVRRLELKMPGYASTPAQLEKADDTLQVAMLSVVRTEAVAPRPVPAADDGAAPAVEQDPPPGDVPGLIDAR